MSAIQSPSTQQDSTQSGALLASADSALTDAHTVSFGSRLHAAREARGLDLGTCAQALKLPARVLRALERDQYDDIDSKIYLANYISTYGRHLGINDGSIQVELDRIKQIEPPLVATGGISHSRFLLDRYATAATYVVLTAVIVVPIIWLGVRGTLDRDISHLAPLDASPIAQIASSDLREVTEEGQSAATAPAAAQKQVSAESDQPLLASMAPFPNMDSTRLTTPAPVLQVGQVGAHSLSLSVPGASWVEVIQADGTKLEYSLLPAGSSRTYHSDQPLSVRIGNANGAQISIDGKAVGLDDFQRANVAAFRVQIQDGKASATTH